MRRLLLLTLLAWSGLVILAGAAMAAAPQFTVVGWELPNGINSIDMVTGLNNLGDVVGSGMTPANKKLAILWDHNHDIGTLLPSLTGYDQSVAYAVNDSAQVVGCCYNSSTGVYQACLWQQGAVQALAPPTGIGPGSSTIAYGINNQGQVVGTASFSNLPGQYPLLWDGGTAQPLESPPLQTTGKAYCISDKGVVGGDHFLWTKAGGFILLQGVVNGINSLGQAVGQTSSSQPCRFDSQGHATVLAGLKSGTANGINDQGQIVGFADGIKFLWQAGQMTDLSKSLLSPGWGLNTAAAINNGMQIAGIGWKTGGNKAQAVLLQAVTRKPTFRITDLGAYLNLYGLNDLGLVVGTSDLGCFLWQGGKLQILMGGGNANAINRAGKIVGAGFIGGLQTAVSWDLQGNMAPLEKSGARNGEAFAVNYSGVAAGQANNGSDSVPCVWKPDGTIQFLTSTQGQARGIADNNLVVGSYLPSGSANFAAFAGTVGGAFLPLTMPGPSLSSSATAVNYSGQVVGYYTSSSTGVQIAFLWQGGTSKNLTSLKSQALSINRAGQVVGGANNNGKDLAFLWEPTLGLLNLNDLLITPQPDWNLTEAIGINGNMQIIGQGTYQGQSHAFLLDRVGTCVTEMAVLLLLQ